MSLNAEYRLAIQRYQGTAWLHSLPPLPQLLFPKKTCGVLSRNTKREVISCCQAGLPPEARLTQHVEEITSNNSHVAVIRDPNLKMYSVMSVKQSSREDLAEHSYQFSCRMSDLLDTKDA